jgi:hypothetical protein
MLQWIAVYSASLQIGLHVFISKRTVRTLYRGGLTNVLETLRVSKVPDEEINSRSDMLLNSFHRIDALPISLSAEVASFAASAVARSASLFSLASAAFAFVVFFLSIAKPDINDFP